MMKNVLIALRTSVKLIIVFIIATLLIASIIIFVYKPIYKVYLNGECLGYSQDKQKLQTKINNYIEKGDEDHVAFVQIDELPFFQAAAFWVRYNDTSNPAGKLFTQLHKNRPAHWVQTDIIRAPVPVCGGAAGDVAAFGFPGQYGWNPLFVECV